MFSDLKEPYDDILVNDLILFRKSRLIPHTQGNIDDFFPYCGTDAGFIVQRERNGSGRDFRGPGDIDNPGGHDLILADNW
jgi:hypothetical protein